MIHRGVRNNNPFNIKISSSNWLNKLPRKFNTDGVFEQFFEMKYGLRAGIRLLRNYQLRYGIGEIRFFIQRFAPSSENDTKRYINFVCEHLRSNGFYVFDISYLTIDTIEFYTMCQAILLYESKYNVSTDYLSKVWKIK